MEPKRFALGVCGQINSYSSAVVSIFLLQQLSWLGHGYVVPMDPMEIGVYKLFWTSRLRIGLVLLFPN